MAKAALLGLAALAETVSTAIIEAATAVAVGTGATGGQEAPQPTVAMVARVGPARMPGTPGTAVSPQMLAETVVTAALAVMVVTAAPQPAVAMAGTVGGAE